MRNDAFSPYNFQYREKILLVTLNKTIQRLWAANVARRVRHLAVATSLCDAAQRLVDCRFARIFVGSDVDIDALIAAFAKKRSSAHVPSAVPTARRIRERIEQVE